MPGFLVTLSATLLCSHGGKGTPTSTSPVVKIMGQVVVMGSSPVTIGGCPFQAVPTSTNPPSPGPCLSASLQPITGTKFVKSLGQPLACLSSASGPASVLQPPGPYAPVPPLPLQPISNAGQTFVRGM